MLKSTRAHSPPQTTPRGGARRFELIFHGVWQVPRRHCGVATGSKQAAISGDRLFSTGCWRGLLRQANAALPTNIATNYASASVQAGSLRIIKQTALVYAREPKRPRLRLRMLLLMLLWLAVTVSTRSHATTMTASVRPAAVSSTPCRLNRQKTVTVALKTSGWAQVTTHPWAQSSDTAPLRPLSANDKARRFAPEHWIFAPLALLPQHIARSQSASQMDSPAKTPTINVCVQAIDYFPHYDFSTATPRGYAVELLERFFHQSGVSFRWVALPIKRVYLDERCDLIYPDNPNWHAQEPTKDLRHYSVALTTIIGSTLVRRGEAARPLASIRSIGLPRGFTPDHLLELQRHYDFKLVETVDASAALQMLLKQRVDAVDVEWHVAHYLLRQLAQPDAVEQGKELPLVRIGFHLSSQRHAAVLQQLDQFIARETAWVLALTQRYQLTATP